MPRTCSASLTRDFSYTDAVERVIERGCLVAGPETDGLEAEFAEWLGVEEHRVVAVSSGTDALTALLRERKVGPGDEVIVPAATFTATALAVVAAGATPVFVDVDETWNLSPDALERALSGERKPKAIIAVDLHGVPADWHRIEEVAGPDVLLFEDACPAYGARYGDVPAGRLGRDGAAFSLNESKQLFGGEGGLVVASSTGVALRLRELRHFGHDPRFSGFRGGSLLRASLVGSNWKITEMAAAIARVCLRTLNGRVAQSRYAGDVIRAAVAAAGVPGLHTHPIPPTAEPSWFKLRVSAPDLPSTYRIADHLEREGVAIARDEVAVLTEHPAFFSYPYGPIPNADRLACTFCIGDRVNPVFGLTRAEADRWAEVVRCIPSKLVSP